MRSGLKFYLQKHQKHAAALAAQLQAAETEIAQLHAALSLPRLPRRFEWHLGKRLWKAEKQRFALTSALEDARRNVRNFQSATEQE